MNTFSLLTAAAGWYYLFYSRAAHRLESVEAERTNARRIILRRAGGVAMLLLGILFFAGFQVQQKFAFLAIWIGVLVLLGGLVILALIDMRLTMKLRRQRGEHQR